MIKLLIALSVFITSEIHAQQSFNKLNVKELDVTSRVNVVSTTKSSKPCPAMTETQRDLIASPATGSCIYNTTALQLNIYDGAAWQSAGGGGIENWLTATAYDVDDVVIESNKIYQCETAHTSGTFATDLAALKWVELSAQQAVNLTGPITSVGAATSIASQTGTGSTFVVQNTPTLTTPNIGAATGTSLTLAGNISAYNYDKDDLLVNGSLENPLGAEWTCTTGAAAATSTSGEVGKGLSALKMTSGTGTTIRCYQTVTTLAGAPVQHYVRGFYKFLLADLPDFQICTLINGNLLANEQSCIPTARLIGDNTYQPFEIPITVTPGQSVGVVFKTTATSTAKSAFVDTLSLKQGLGLQNLMTDTEFSAQANISAVVSQLSKPSWIGNGSIVGAIYTYPITGFTVAPNCWAVNSTHGAGSARLLNTQSTANTVAVEVTNTSGATASTTMSIGCQKSGNDYLASSANVYSQANQNVSAIYTGAPPTGTLTSSFNTVTFGTKVKDTHNAYSSGTYTVPVTASYDISTGVAVSGTYNGAQQLATSIYINGAAKYQNSNAPTTSIGRAWTNLSVQSIPLVAGDLVTIRVYNDGTGLSYESNAATNYFSITRSDANVISGSFENVPTVPGAGARIDTFSVSYGTTNATTVCSANPCSYFNQIGSGATSMGWTSAGLMTLNLGKTYTNFKCTGNASVGPSDYRGFLAPMTCTNCSSVTIRSVFTDNAASNTYGTLHCQGTY